MLWIRLCAVLCLLFLVDLYFYQSVKTAFNISSIRQRKKLFTIYISITIIASLIVIITFLSPPALWNKNWNLYVFSIILILVFAKTAGIIPLICDDLLRLIKFLVHRFRKPIYDPPGKKIPRSVFLSRVSLAAAAVPFSGFLYGMFESVYDFKVRNIRLVFPGLPAAFNGFRIVQISDMHAGSFLSEKPLARVVRIIHGQKPDVVLFTGDLVNYIAGEAEPYLTLLRDIKAPSGVYSILGNHDYGLYYPWKNDFERNNNLLTLKDMEQFIGWKLLLNSNEIIERNKEKILIAGVENWSTFNHFPRYGRIDLALDGATNVPFKILLTHDPTHWDGEILSAGEGIDLTMAGHTHGMQMGVDIGSFRWSPVQYMYRQWADLYNEGRRFLYVNRGLGCIGYMGRLGVLPEITVIDIFAE